MANARIMAAAPTLADALLVIARSDATGSWCRDVARAALAAEPGEGVRSALMLPVDAEADARMAALRAAQPAEKTRPITANKGDTK